MINVIKVELGRRLAHQFESDTYTRGMDETWLACLEKNACYYGLLKSHFGKVEHYDDYYYFSYKAYQITLFKLWRAFGCHYEIKLYDPFKLGKSVIDGMLTFYFTWLKSVAIKESDPYSVLSWGMGKDWFSYWEGQAYLVADIKTKFRAHPRYYRYYVESFLFGMLVKEKAAWWVKWLKTV